MNFTDHQKAAIAHLDGNLQLIACAGSGKTEVVAQQVVNLLRPTADGGGGRIPASIVAFTYNDKAAGELKERIHTRCHQAFDSVTGLAEMYVGTIHGFCLDLLKSEVPAYMKYEVLSDVQQSLFIDRHSSASGLTRSTTLRGQRLRRYVDTKSFATALSILREDVIANGKALENNTVASHLEEYEELLHSKSYLDYSGILKEAVEQLKINELLRNRLAARVKHVIVDEYQDVNPIQEAVIGELSDLGADVCVVGDDDQALYQWRGSDVQNVLTFSERYSEVETIPLEENFRSSEGVIAVAVDVIGSVENRLLKEMEPAGGQDFESGDIVALSLDSPEEEAAYIAETCSQLRGLPIKDDGEMRGISWSDMAILLRNVSRDGGPIMEALSQAGIPYVVTGMDDLFGAPEAEAARCLFYFLAGRADERSLLDAWQAAQLGLDQDFLETAIRQASRARDAMGDADVGQYSVYNLQRQFIHFIETAGLEESKIPGVRGEVAFYNLGKFSQVISDFESIHFHSKPVDKYDSFAGFLKHGAENAYPEGWQESAYVTPDAVQILTVHKAKGLQWPAVFIPQLVRNRFPGTRGGGRTAWHLLPAEAFENAERYRGGAEDERRLFYVAVTRAQKYLHLTWAPTEGNRRAQRPSEFFEEAQASKFVKRRRQDYAERERLAPTPRTSVSNVVLSFSDLKYFFECPYQFKMRIQYGFNAPLDEALGYGKSLHDALAEVHHRALEGEILTPEAASELVDRHLRAPYAYPALKEKLAEAAERAVSGYIEKNAADFPNLEFVEKGIEISLGDGVAIAGRIDLVKRIDTGEVTIVDLKSSERAQAEDVTEAQLHVYALGYLELTGRNADYVEIYELDGQKPKRRSVDEEFIEDVQASTREAAQALRSNALDPTPHKRTCSTCDYGGLCAGCVSCAE